MSKDSLVWGSPGHLSQTDQMSIAHHFEAILGILKHTGMDRVHILEFIQGLLDNWWIDSAIHLCDALLGAVGLWL